MSHLGEPRLEPGSVFQGAYDVLEELAAGSFGRVYKACQRSTGQAVALKLLRLVPETDADDRAIRAERFRREMRLCARLSHPNIVRLIDSGETRDGQLYAVFEYVPGTTLAELLEREGALPIREAVHVMTQVLDALGCAHAAGVVHRDLKPENIMVTRTGLRRNAMVLDFGLSGFTAGAAPADLPRLTMTLELMGTPCYAAPEQLRGAPPSPRSDLYSWGLILLEALTGGVAVGGATAYDVVARQLAPEPIAIPRSLEHHPVGRVLAAVLEKQVEKRTVTIEGLLEMLEGLEFAGRERPEGTPPAARASASERRQVTVVSCRFDVTRSDGSAPDVEDIDEVLRLQHALVTETASRHGGRVAQVLGEHVLLVFGYPRVREHEARRAARAALRVVDDARRASARLGPERGLAVSARAGVHTGLVVVRPGERGAQLDLLGLTPEIAAQIAAAAGPGDVLVTDDTQRLLRGDVATEPAGDIAAAGGTLALFRLLGGGREAALESTPWARETPLVGRADQLERLTAAWGAAEEGRPAVVLVTGEPGIGKSRLLRELRRRVPPEAWYEARCTMEVSASPLRPIVDLLARLGPMEALLERHAIDRETTLPLFRALLSSTEAGSEPLPYTAERQKELTLAGIVSLLVRMAQARAIVLAVEDLHWADPTTLELVSQLGQEVATAQMAGDEIPTRLCLVLTARPEFVPPWSLDAVAIVQLSRLTAAQVEAMVGAGLAAGRPLPAPLLARVVSRADGIPLFVEELTRVLVEARADATGDDADAIELPATLRDLLTARLDTLDPGTRETTQLAAVLGREFRWDLLHAVTGQEAASVRAHVRTLEDAGLVFPRRSARVETYLFRHSLVRDAAYDSMTRVRRRAAHARAASVLVDRFPEIARSEPERVARHLELDDAPEAAVEQWFRAGDRARRRAAYPEAVRQLEHAGDLLARLPGSVARDRLEIRILTSLGTALLSTNGYAAPEVERTFTRAQGLAESLGEDVPLEVLAGIAGVHLTRGQLAPNLALVPRLERLAARTDDTVASITGHALLGVHTFWAGDFAAALRHMQVGMALHDTPEFQAFAREYGHDGGLLCHCYAMGALWNLGFSDRAEALRLDTLAMAEASRNPYSLAVALGFGTTVSHDRGEPERTLEQALRLAALANEQKLYLFLAIAACAQAGAMLQQEMPEGALAAVEQGLAILEGVGVRTSHSYYLTYLAEAQLGARRIEQGLETVAEGLRRCASELARFHEADLWRLRGDLLRAQGDPAAAEAAFARGIGVARTQGARSFELRATTRLARLLRDEGRTADARALLAPCLAGFDEGFETADLRTAAALHAELEGSAAGVR